MCSSGGGVPRALKKLIEEREQNLPGLLGSIQEHYLLELFYLNHIDHNLNILNHYFFHYLSLNYV